jgi:hypothetical protein
MKIVLVASINGKDKQKFFYLSIIGILKNFGHDVFYEHIIKETSESLSKSHKKNINFHKNVIKRIRDADLIVSEITHESVSVGYLIHEALLSRKPVIALSRLDSTPNMSLFLENFKNFTFFPYKKVFELEKNLPDLIKKIPMEKTKRFNCLLSESLDLKLEKIAKERNTSKAEIIRSIIEKL